jgi:hypothetical protein
MKQFKFRASGIGKIMTEAKSKDDPLSVGAKTEILHMAKELVYGFTRTFSSKYTEKGTTVEDQSIALYNAVHFTSHVKNTERKTNDWVTGECDIFTGSKIIDIKSPWSLETFPATAAAGHDTGYEWQLRAYMWLWDVDQAEIAYCMVSTPEELVGYEREELHFVDQIPEALRVTRVQYTRDKALEDRMKFKVEAANRYLQQLVKQIADEHDAALEAA